MRENSKKSAIDHLVQHSATRILWTNQKQRKSQSQTRMHGQGTDVSNDILFHFHIPKMVAMFKRKSGQILGTFRTKSYVIMLVIWRKFILNCLDYCSQRWPSHSATPIRLNCINGTVEQLGEAGKNYGSTPFKIKKKGLG